jgi:hypothetical protein
MIGYNGLQIEKKMEGPYTPPQFGFIGLQIEKKPGIYIYPRFGYIGLIVNSKSDRSLPVKRITKY